MDFLCVTLIVAIFILLIAAIIIPTTNPLKVKIFRTLCEEFNITESELKEYLKDIFILYPQLEEIKTGTWPFTTTEKHWWTHPEKVATIEHLLDDKISRGSFEKLNYEELMLRNENLRLQNESLSVDIEQKRNWKCTYCDNINPATSFPV